MDETAKALGLRVTQGKLVLEVRPPARVDKGTAVLRLALHLGALRNGSALVFAGDDQTDEDAFRALRTRAPAAVTVRVTHGESVATAAEFTVRDPEEMRLFLEWLLAART